MMNIRTLFGSAIVLASTLAAAHAADVPNAKDPPGFKRFAGSEILHSARSNYAPYVLARADVNILQSYSFAKSETVEGEVNRLVYLVPEGHSSLEVFRNYQDMLSQSGFEKTFELDPTDIQSGNYFFGAFYFQAERDARYAHETTPFTDSKNDYYMTGERTVDGRKVTVALLVGESTGLNYVPEGLSGPQFSLKNGQTVVELDLVSSKAIANQMVLVTAADMSKELWDTGKVDLYGIYFDTDKTDLKPESDKTLNEVASLLKIDRSLKLEISGHTDNTGSAAHNLSLSQGRAESVVQTLVRKYGIEAARLQAKGYGDTKPVASNDGEAGRAKNRRVELRKL